MSKIAMISYNTFVSESHNGWHENEQNAVLLLQNSNGNSWGVNQVIPRGQESQWINETKAIVDPLWEQLKKELPTLDYVVMYVGSNGAERVIELAAENGLTPDRAVFVLCDCNYYSKIGLIRSWGFIKAKLIDCECGGHNTMRKIFHDALDGLLPS